MTAFSNLLDSRRMSEPGVAASPVQGRPRLRSMVWLSLVALAVGVPGALADLPGGALAAAGPTSAVQASTGPDADTAKGRTCSDPATDCTLRGQAGKRNFFVGSISGDRRRGSSVVLDPAFAKALVSHFNSVTVENALKWGPLSPAPGVYDFERADKVVEFGEQQGLRVRGHTLIWARINGMPDWLADNVESADDPAARLRELIEEHIATVVGRYRGRIAVWDVVNEPLHLFGPDLDPYSLYTQILGPEYIALAFKAARRADPEALLGINETLVINNEAKFGAFLFLMGQLKAQSVPIDVVGLQGQFILNPPPSRAELRRKLEALASLGFRVEITELNIPLGFYRDEPDPLAAQAAAYADVFGACLDVPACMGVTTWGLYDGETWLDDFFPWLAPARPSMLDEQYRRKPAYEAVLEMLTAATTRAASSP